MATIYLYSLFVLLIVFALRLDCYEATAFPPPGFRIRCLLIVEVEVVFGIYRYDPDEEVTHGNPKLVKLKYTPGKKVDYNVVDSRYYLSYNNERLYTWALRFSYGELRLNFDVLHPCSIRAEIDDYFNIYHSVPGAPLKGYGQLRNGIIDVECVPQHGTLSSTIKYAVPTYPEMKTVYTCVTFLRVIENEAEVDSRATAAHVDFSSGTCTLFYEQYANLTPGVGEGNYCYLKDFTHVDYPGFYTGCKIYIEDPVYVGLWELDVESEFAWMPYLRKRHATMDTPSSQKVTLHPGFMDDDFYARLDGNQLQFLSDDHATLSFEMQWHICIGPDLDVSVRKETTEGISLAKRRDKGLDCVPFYGKSTYNDSRFLGLITITLEVAHTVTRCHDYLTGMYRSAEWKMIGSTVDVGPCVGFGGGIDYASVTRTSAVNSYSCFSTKYYQPIPLPNCSYGVEAGDYESVRYAGFYLVDLSYKDSFTHYPPFNQKGKNPDGLLIWDNGYKLKGLGEIWTVGLQHSTCSKHKDKSAGDSRLVKYEGRLYGRVGRMDDDRFCKPKMKTVVVPYGNPGFHYFEHRGVWSMDECIAVAESFQKIGWKAYARIDSYCRAWGERLDIKTISLFRSSINVASCIHKQNRRLTPPKLDEDCLVSVGGLDEYCGKYTMDLSFLNNFSYYPTMLRKTFTIGHGVIIKKETDAFIKTERIDGKLVFTLYGTGKRAHYEISADSHICETSHAVGAILPIVNKEGAKVGYIYKLDPTIDSCDPLGGVWESKDHKPTTSVSADFTFPQCQESISTTFPEKKWTELVKADDFLCRAWDASLDTRDVTRQMDKYGRFIAGCTCVIPENFHPTPSISDPRLRECKGIVIDPVFHSLYALKLNSDDDEHFPHLVAKKIVRVGTTNTLTVGDFFEESEEGYRYIEYDHATGEQKLHSADGTIRDITPTGFICFEDYDDQPSVFNVVNHDNGEATGSLERVSEEVSCEIVDGMDHAQFVIEQLIQCPGTDHVICHYGGRQSLATCLSDSNNMSVGLV